MSAIWAVLHFDGRPVEAGDLERMAAALTALGPERTGHWHAGPAGLGHGLQAFTPEDRLEQQPLVDPAGRYVLVVDGRVDNRPELCAALGLPAAALRDWPDSAFVQQAYARWGEACPAHLIGALSFIVWQPAERRLFAASTPGNASALFYHQHRHRLALASLPAGVLALPDTPRLLNEAKLADYLAHSRQHRAATFFQDVWRLPAGHTLTAHDGQVQVQRYWSPDLTRDIRFARDDDYVAAFNELFERIVSDHRRSLTPVGVMMSGGLDSSSVAVTAARQLAPNRLATYTEVPVPGAATEASPYRYNDERPLVEAIAALHPNLDPHFIHTAGQSFLDDLDARFDHHQTILRNAINHTWLERILRTAAADGRRVLLVGDHGNQTMSVAGQGLLAEYVRAGQLGRAWHEAQALARRQAASSAGRALLGYGLAPLLPARLQTLVDRLRRPGRRPDSDFVALRPGYAAAFGLRPGQVEPFIAANGRQSRADILTQQMNHHVPAYRSEFGVDMRDPTNDQRLIEFCLALPAHQFLRDGQPRWLIRRAMAGRLPPTVLNNRRRGRQASDWFDALSARQAEIAATLAQLEQDELARRALDLPRLRSLLADWPASTAAAADPPDRLRLYRETLIDGLMGGRFVLWFNRGP